MAYNHKKGLCWFNGDICFLPIPKNASTSIRNTFKFTNTSIYLDEHTSTKSMGKLITVIRNPMDRLVSGYLEIIYRAAIDTPKTITKKFYNMPENKDRFIEFILEIEQDLFDAHIEQQCYYITDFNDNLLPFYRILLFDNLQEDFNQLLNDLSLNNNLKHLKNQDKEKKDIVYNYIKNDVYLIDKINKIYEKDFFIYNKIKNKK